MKAAADDVQRKIDSNATMNLSMLVIVTRSSIYETVSVRLFNQTVESISHLISAPMAGMSARSLFPIAIRDLDDSLLFSRNVTIDEQPSYILCIQHNDLVNKMKIVHEDQVRS